MSDKIHLTASIPEEYIGMRYDMVLAKLFPDYSRSKLSQWLKQGDITINQQVVKGRDKAQGGENIILDTTLKQQHQWQAQALPLDIIAEDDDIIVINKPANLVVHPAAGNPNNTLVNALLHHCPSLEQLPRAGIVHRLDKDTTGLLVVAKNLAAHHSLVSQLQQRSIKREYLTLVTGQLVAGNSISAAIGRHPKNRLKMAVCHNGKPAVTHYRVLKKYPEHSLLTVQLETGRTHQIRVHFAHMKYPIVGDPLYGNRLRLPKGASDELILALRQFHRQALHAKHLSFIHPSQQQLIEFSAPIADDFATLLTIFDREYHLD